MIQSYPSSITAHITPVPALYVILKYFFVVAHRSRHQKKSHLRLSAGFVLLDEGGALCHVGNPVARGKI